MRLPKLKPILGHLLNVLAAASLLLAIVVGSLWWQSYQNPEHYWVSYRSGGIDAVKTDRGEFAIARRRTPFRLRKTQFYHEAGGHVRPRLSPGSQREQWRWGPLVYAASPPGPPPTPEQVREVEALYRVARAFDAVVPPQESDEHRDWSLRRALAYREASTAERRLNLARSSLWMVVVPAWLLMPPLLVLPAVSGLLARRQWRARMRAEAGTCARCGRQRLAPGVPCMACVTAPPNDPATVGGPQKQATPAGEAAPPAARLPYTDRGDLAARVAAYRRDRVQHRSPPRRPRPSR